MSQSSNSPLDNKILSGLSKAVADNKANVTKAKQGIKRVASGQFENVSKRTAVKDHSCEEQVSSLVPKPFDEAKFISAAKMVANVHTNGQPIFEIPDEEFLKMALEFENKYPQ